ncbi:hypothetical protein DL93DRAFT_2087826 [Clavulina sp. PMI_390]|nr:hypothetical protein DL93DRAFT_2087826 [Clavulina sp. PMI_390]
MCIPVASVGSLVGLALSFIVVGAAMCRSSNRLQDKERFKLAVENLRAGASDTNHGRFSSA